MMRFALIFIMSLALSSQAVSADEWNYSNSKQNEVAERIFIPKYFFAG